MTSKALHKKIERQAVKLESLAYYIGANDGDDVVVSLVRLAIVNLQRAMDLLEQADDPEYNQAVKNATRSAVEDGLL
jgi:hypothetical protein